MAEFTVKLAGRSIGVRSLFSSSRDYCRAYFTEEPPLFHVSTAPEDLEFEQNMAREEARLEGFRPRNFPDPFLDRAAIHRKITDGLFDYDILVLHGSVVAVDGQGYLFTAKSGTGKSTHTRFWREIFGSRAVTVNDDKPFLRIEAGCIWVCGSPWSGKHGLDTNVTVPLKGICILERGTENTIRPIAPEDALPMLLHQSAPPSDPRKLDKFTRLVTAVAIRTPLWKMQCTPEPMAAAVAYESMSAWADGQCVTDSGG